MVCKRCGAVIERAASNRRYCDRCNAEIKAEYEKERYMYKKKMEYSKKALKNMSNLDECVFEAEKMGLSYGEYMAYRTGVI